MARSENYGVFKNLVVYIATGMPTQLKKSTFAELSLVFRKANLTTGYARGDFLASRVHRMSFYYVLSRQRNFRKLVVLRFLQNITAKRT